MWIIEDDLWRARFLLSLAWEDGEGWLDGSHVEIIHLHWESWVWWKKFGNVVPARNE